MNMAGISVITWNFLSLESNPMAAPATAFFKGTPAFKSAKVEAQSAAIEVEALAARTSETTRIA